MRFLLGKCAGIKSGNETRGKLELLTSRFARAVVYSNYHTPNKGPGKKVKKIDMKTRKFAFQFPNQMTPEYKIRLIFISTRNGRVNPPEIPSFVSSANLFPDSGPLGNGETMPLIPKMGPWAQMEQVTRCHIGLTISNKNIHE